MDEPVYIHRRALASGIPLGGLGTGSVEIRGDGRFHDWEIFNNNLWSGNPAHLPPDMWSEDAFFAVRVREEGKPPVVRLLYDDDKRSRAVSLKHDYSRIYSFPFLWNIEEIAYSGQYPFAHLKFADSRLPLDIALSAFTPFIPFHSKDSGLPLAFFVFRIANTGTAPCDASLLFGLRNCAGYDLDQVHLAHRTVRTQDAVSICMTAEDADPCHRTFGSMAVTALDPEATFMTAWTDDRGLEGFKNAHAPGFGQTLIPFRDHGSLAGVRTDWDRVEVRKTATDCCRTLSEVRDAIHHWRGAVCSKVRLHPGETREVVFLMSWFFPNHYFRHLSDRRLGHMYENWFGDALEVARYGVQHFPRLRDASRAFCDNLYRGLPPWLAASLNAQLTTFPQAFWWTKNGDFTVWEGMACCQLIHAASTPWSSFQPLLFFPDLYLEMRRRMARFTPDGEGSGACSDLLAADLQWRRGDWKAAEPCCGGAAPKTEEKADEKPNDLGGWLPERYRRLGYAAVDFPHCRPGDEGSKRPFAFGESASAQLLRDFLWTNDADFLRELWPFARHQILGGLAADRNGDGLPDGDLCGTTYDHWFLPGISCYGATMWLAELRAAARLAEILGDSATRDAILPALERGRMTFEERLWNGEYYNLGWDTVRNSADRGCLADQVSGHLYLRLCGIPPVHAEDHVRSALAAVFRHNRRQEQGLLNGADPFGREDWRWFARYSERGEDEALGGQWPTPWSGTEYYVAAVMIAEGLVQEGLQVVKDVYDRHVAYGQLYNHIECGEHYFRPMSLWALLPALQGLVYDAQEACLTFAPRIDPGRFDTLFILPHAWGRLTQRRAGQQQENEIRVNDGALSLQRIGIEVPADNADRLKSATATVNGTGTDVERSLMEGRALLSLHGKVTLRPGDSLRLQVAW